MYSDEFFIGNKLKLFGPYWNNNQGKGREYRTACGWNNLYIGDYNSKAIKPIKISQKGNGTIGYCDWDSAYIIED